MKKNKNKKEKKEERKRLSNFVVCKGQSVGDAQSSDPYRIDSGVVPTLVLQPGPNEEKVSEVTVTQAKV